MNTTGIMEDKTLQSLFSGFAGPMVPMDLDLFELLATTYASESLEQFLKKIKPLCPDLNSLGDFLRVFLKDRELNRQVAWDISFGKIHTSLLFEDNRQAMLDAAAHLALWLHFNGHPGNWQVHLEQPVRVRVGRFLLPPLKDFACDAESGRIQIRNLASRNHLIQFENQAGEWVAKGVHTFPQIEWGNHRITLINDLDLVVGSVDAGRIIRDEEGLHAMVSMGEQALAWMAAHAPEYLDWVLRTVKYIIPTRSENGALTSGSTKYYYGQIHASLTEIPLALAESLVHESAHQHFYLAARFMPITNGKDLNWYYSPPVRAERQIEKILLAIHAFVNVLALSRSCPSDDEENYSYACRNEENVNCDIQKLVLPLVKTQGLTPVGQAVAQPLIDYMERG